MPYGGAILNYDRLTAKADAGVHLDARVHKEIKGLKRLFIKLSKNWHRECNYHNLQYLGSQKPFF